MPTYSAWSLPVGTHASSCGRQEAEGPAVRTPGDFDTVGPFVPDSNKSIARTLKPASCPCGYIGVSLGPQDSKVCLPGGSAARISCVDGDNALSPGSPFSMDVWRRMLSGPLCSNAKLDGTHPDASISSSALSKSESPTAY
ncbi:hypothetical protein MRX96_030566 [Rhipicephalus microplus]